MPSKLSKLLPLLPTAAPAIAAAAEMVLEELERGGEDAKQREQLAQRRAELERREAELKRREAELKRREAELKRREAELERARTWLRKEGSQRAAERAPSRGAGSFQRHTTPAPPVRLPIWEMVDGKLQLLEPERMTWAWCVAFATAPANVRAQVSRQRRSQYRRVALLPFHVGSALDAAGVAFHAIRFIAYGEGALEQQGRCELIMNGQPPPRRL